MTRLFGVFTAAALLVGCQPAESPGNAVNIRQSKAALATNAPVLRGATSNSVSTTSSIAISVPAGTVSGDLLIAFVSNSNGSATDISTPSGWTVSASSLSTGSSSSDARLRYFYKFAGSSEPGSYTFSRTGTTNVDMAGGMYAFGGVNPAAPINVAQEQSNGNSSNCTAPTLTTTDVKTYLIITCTAAGSVRLLDLRPAPRARDHPVRAHDGADHALSRMGDRRRVGPYELLWRLAQGGTGEIWEARIRGDSQRKFALKVLPEASEADPVAVRQFQEEARLRKSLSHPNIVRTLDIGVAEGRPFIAMELSKGENLARLFPFPGKPHPPGLAVGLALQMLAALGHARLAHGNIKPSNLFVTDEGVVKVLDFGATQGPALDTRNDLLSLASVIRDILSGGAASLPRQTPAPLQEVLEAALNPNRENRPSSPAQMANALRQSLPEAEIWSAEQIAQWMAAPIPSAPSPHQDSPAPSPVRYQRPRRPWRAAVFAALVLAVAALAFYLGKRYR